MSNGFDELIEALQIFKKYSDASYPTGCEHDTLYVYVNPEEVSEEDKERLDEIGFIPSDFEAFMSFKYGSA